MESEYKKRESKRRDKEEAKHPVIQAVPMVSSEIQTEPPSKKESLAAEVVAALT